MKFEYNKKWQLLKINIYLYFGIFGMQCSINFLAESFWLKDGDLFNVFVILFNASLIP